MARTKKDYEINTQRTIPTSNKYNLFQDFPALTYAQASQTPSLSSKAPQPAIQKEKSPYFTKNIIQHITLTKFKEVPLYGTLKALTQRIFPEGCYWCSDDPLKNQAYCELILVDTGSVEILPKSNPQKPNEIAHCKCIIKKVCSPAEWASFYSKKNFSIRRIPDGFTYQDYK